MDEIHLEPEEPERTKGEFSKEESAAFYRKLRLHFVQYLVYPILFLKNPNFQLKIGQVPPVMDPLLAGSTVYDTEREARTFHFCFCS